MANNAAIARAQDGAAKGSIGGPYGAIFGALDGYFNGPLYKTTVPKGAKGSKLDNLAFSPLQVPEPAEIEYASPEEILAAWRGEVIGHFPEYSKIGGMLNTDEQQAAQNANLMANPQYYALLSTLTNKALDYSSGRLPQDVKQNILQQANEDSYLKGFVYGKSGGGGNVYAGGNDAAANLALRNLGLTSLDLSRYGLQLTGSALEQSRASRGRVVSALDTIPTQQFFQNQMNLGSEGEYMNEQNRNNYEAAVANAPAQAAYNQLLFRANLAGQQASQQAGQTQMLGQLFQAGMQLYGMYRGSGGGFGGGFGGATTGSTGSGISSGARTAGAWNPNTTVGTGLS
jgi:hypothetical protein